MRPSELDHRRSKQLHDGLNLRTGRRKDPVNWHDSLGQAGSNRQVQERLDATVRAADQRSRKRGMKMQLMKAVRAALAAPSCRLRERLTDAPAQKGFVFRQQPQISCLQLGIADHRSRMSDITSLVHAGPPPTSGARAGALAIGLRQTRPPQQDCAVPADRPFLVCAGVPLP